MHRYFRSGEKKFGLGKYFLYQTEWFTVKTYPNQNVPKSKRTQVESKRTQVESKRTHCEVKTYPCFFSHIFVKCS